MKVREVEWTQVSLRDIRKVEISDFETSVNCTKYQSSRPNYYEKQQTHNFNQGLGL